jgi:hypothetical protein
MKNKPQRSRHEEQTSLEKKLPLHFSNVVLRIVFKPWKKINHTLVAVHLPNRLRLPRYTWHQQPIPLLRALEALQSVSCLSYEPLLFLLWPHIIKSMTHTHTFLSFLLNRLSFLHQHKRIAFKNLRYSKKVSSNRRWSVRQETMREDC